ncbi:unnamed protein product [Clavelina lepadiformis]|uniref:2-methoxy-6-polyprenyl-1,4-benzoquinol methylase, mitochondrial n=1 Tax=Clavelina lepadiformis TaxID=159417 RepID=A0ABP0GKM4_CLALP
MFLLNRGKAIVLSCASISQASYYTTAKRLDENYTHFGYKTVKTEEKAGRVLDVFSSVASKYDMMNDVMSGGLHRLWKDRMIQKLNPDNKAVLLDCAGGTGDIAFRFVNYVERQHSQFTDHPNVTVCDINNDILEVGKSRALERGVSLNWVCSNAEELPFPDQSFTCYTIAFGIRNCTNISKVLQEAYRVLRPGGRFVCLEFSHVSNPILSKIYDTYSFQVIPVMGEVIAGDWNSYQYLVESIRKFPAADEFKQMISNVGFKVVAYEPLTFGTCAIHSGFRLK